MMQPIYELHDDQISTFWRLYQNEWWTQGRTLEETKQCIKGSQICIGIIDGSGELCGFARVLTDYIFKAVILDVIVSPVYRGDGLGDQLIELIVRHEKLHNVKHFELYCLPEFQAFYARHGFTTDVGNVALMRYATP
ncbi:MAG: GNAT family N-acetyltransferase [Nitrospirota bacterium]|nr:GNAT family N-acetyltransferase [Nitrospirota bacterium]